MQTALGVVLTFLALLSVLRWISVFWSLAFPAASFARDVRERAVVWLRRRRSAGARARARGRDGGIDCVDALWRRVRDGDLDTLGNGCLRLAWIGLSIFYLTGRSGAFLEDMGFDTRRVFHDVALGVRLFVLAILPVYGVQFIFVQVFEMPSEHPLVKMVRQQPDARFLLLTTVVAAGIVPLFEEFSFRVCCKVGWKRSSRNRAELPRRPTAPRLAGDQPSRSRRLFARAACRPRARSAGDLHFVAVSRLCLSEDASPGCARDAALLRQFAGHARVVGRLFGRLAGEKGPFASVFARPVS